LDVCAVWEYLNTSPSREYGTVILAIRWMDFQRTIGQMTDKNSLFNL
jgi:hypothetical protein